MHFTARDYDALERAISDRTRIAAWRRGTEYLVVPQRLILRGSREELHARHPTTGEPIVLVLDELERMDLVR